MSDSGAPGRLKKRIVLGSAAGIGVAVAALALGSSQGCAPAGDVQACDPTIWPNGDVPPECYPGMCVPLADPCLYDSDCCTRTCVKGVCQKAASGGTDAGDASADGPIDGCDGVCLPASPDGWDHPNLVWIGPEPDAPACPQIAGVLAYEGRVDPSGSTHCAPCVCGPPTGACTLPATLTANAASCAAMDPSTAQTPFDPPSGWDGGCTTNDAVPADAPCDGGPCAQSLTIAAPTVAEIGCTVMQDALEQGPVDWGAFARACTQAVETQCDDNKGLCVPLAPPGFKTCIYQMGDDDCPTDIVSPYTEKHVFYEGVVDTRSCTTCSCSAPSGSVCSAEIFVYDDSGCADVPSYSATVSSTSAECHDLTPGAALGSKSSSAPTYTPGACQPSGGQPTGGVAAVIPSTFCCIP